MIQPSPGFMQGEPGMAGEIGATPVKGQAAPALTKGGESPIPVLQVEQPGTTVLQCLILPLTSGIHFQQGQDRSQRGLECA